MQLHRLTLDHSIQVEIRPDGILTPGLCQICKQGGPGIIEVRGLTGRLFSAHRWPCAEREGLVKLPPY